MTPKISDIAEKLKLSKSTVSSVLSGKGDYYRISKDTQAKILSYASQVNYVPNMLAQALQSGETHFIGLIVPFINDPFFFDIIRAIEIEAEKFGYSITFCSSESDGEREDRLIRMLRSKQVDGILISPTQQSKSEIKKMYDDAFPFVFFDRYIPEMDVSYVTMDNEECSYQLVKGLIKSGRKKIAVITSDNHINLIQMRYAGYKKALKEFGILLNANLKAEILLSDYKKGVWDFLDGLFQKEPGVDGFYFTTTYQALEALSYFHKKKIDPNKFGLACMHEMPSFDILAPEMSIGLIPVEEIGKKSIELLMDYILNKKQGKKNKTKHYVLSSRILKNR